MVKKCKHKRIYLKNRNKYAIVDAEMFTYLNKWKWTSNYNGIIYVIRAKDGIGLHRLIMSAKKGQEVDHINGNALDNRRCNLRLCSHQQNCQNRRRRLERGFSSKYKGVSKGYFTKKRSLQMWTASIRQYGKSGYLGSFKSEIEAAKSYDAKALELFGEFACTNFKKSANKNLDKQPTNRV